MKRNVVVDARRNPAKNVQRLMRKPFKAPEWVATRESNKIYQNGNVVGEVIGPVQEQDSIIRFEKLANTGALNKGGGVSIPTAQPQDTTYRPRRRAAKFSRRGPGDGRP